MLLSFIWTRSRILGQADDVTHPLQIVAQGLEECIEAVPMGVKSLKDNEQHVCDLALLASIKIDSDTTTSKPLSSGGIAAVFFFYLWTAVSRLLAPFQTRTIS